MANNIDQLNYYDDLIRNEPLKISEDWMNNLSAFIETLQGYLCQFGIFIPILTTAQRNSIQAPVEGQLIYNIDAIAGPPVTAQIQVWQVKAGVAAWRVITTT